MCWAQQILKFVKPNCRLQTTKKVQKFSVKFHPSGFSLDWNTPLSCLLIGSAMCWGFNTGTLRRPALCLENGFFCSKEQAWSHRQLCTSHALPECWAFARDSQSTGEGYMSVLGSNFFPLNPFLCSFKAPLKKIPINKLVKKEDEYEEEKPELEELDWWSKYYASLKELYNQVVFCDSCQQKGK